MVDWLPVAMSTMPSRLKSPTTICIGAGGTFVVRARNEAAAAVAKRHGHRARLGRPGDNPASSSDHQIESLVAVDIGDGDIVRGNTFHRADADAPRYHQGRSEREVAVARQQAAGAIDIGQDEVAMTIAVEVCRYGEHALCDAARNRDRDRLTQGGRPGAGEDEELEP